MSAITGIFRRDGQDVDPAEIKKINDKLAHRGPDGFRIWCEGSVALGHQMLHTTPESLHEMLPFEDEASGLIITADARIDNRQELSKKLGIENGEDVSDSYFILKSYEKWGEKCPDKLLGDFAFAIWDKNNEKLFCARDHMGVKPFYYYLSEGVFFFATEINALLNIPEIPCKLNDLRVADYLFHLVEDREITFYKEIQRLPAASSLNLNEAKAIKICYWKLDPKKEIIMDSDEEYAQKFLQIFTEAVKCRMRSAFPVGSLLSGGLDSSSIVCTANKILNEQNSDKYLKTFSAVYDSVPVCDEQNYIMKVIEGDNLEPYLIKTDKLSPLSQIDVILEKIGEPFNIPNYYIHWEIFQKAQKEDVRILLDGFDGNTTVFSGERYALDLAREMQWKKLLSEIKSMAKYLGINRIQMFFYAVILPLIPELIQKYALQKLLDFMDINLNLSESEHFDIMQKEFIQKTDFKNRFQSLYKEPLKKAKTNKLRHHLRLSSPYLQHAMEILDIFSANFSIEHRYPFFDRRLVEFCLSLPKEQKFSQKWDRVIMRRAMDGILPSEVQWRPGQIGMGAHFRTNIIQFDQKILEDSILKDGDIISGYVKLENLQDAYKDYEKNVEGTTSSFEEITLVDLWLSTLLIIWLKKKHFGNSVIT